MALHDVYRLADGALVLDCQATRFDDIGTRFVLPLMPPDYAPPHNATLIPAFEVDGERVVLVTQLATALRTSELRRRVGSLSYARDQVIAAIDTLIGAR